MLNIDKPDVCFYHFPCIDGFASAMAVHMKWPDVELRPINYGRETKDKLHNVYGMKILFVDFFPGAEWIKKLIDSECHITVLDHHKTAMEEAIDLLKRRLISGIFDMERSGAGITWDVLHGNKTRSRMINYIEDRDLWKFNYIKRTKDFHAFIASHPYDLDHWINIHNTIRNNDNLYRMLSEGAAIRRKHVKDCNEYINELLQWWHFDPDEPFHRAELCGDVEKIQNKAYYRVPVLNIPYTHGSEACHLLLEKFPQAPFAGYYVDLNGIRKWGFRSENNRVDASAVAKMRGGGGHRNACGFEEIL